MDFPRVFVHQAFARPQPHGECSPRFHVTICPLDLTIAHVRDAISRSGNSIGDRDSIVLFTPDYEGKLFLDPMPALEMTNYPTLLALVVASKFERQAIEDFPMLLPHVISRVDRRTQDTHLWLRRPDGDRFLPGTRFHPFVSKEELYHVVNALGFVSNIEAVFQDIVREHRSELALIAKRSARDDLRSLSEVDALAEADLKLGQRGDGFLAAFVVYRLWQNECHESLVDHQQAPYRKHVLAIHQRRFMADAGIPDDDVSSICSDSTIGPSAAVRIGPNPSSRYATTSRGSSPENSPSPPLRRSTRFMTTVPDRETVERFFTRRSAAWSSYRDTASSAAFSDIVSVTTGSVASSIDDASSTSTRLPIRYRATNIVAAGSAAASAARFPASWVSSRSSMDWEATVQQETRLQLEQLEVSTAWAVAVCDAHELRRQHAASQQQSDDEHDRTKLELERTKHLQAALADQVEHLRNELERTQQEHALFKEQHDALQLDAVEGATAARTFEEQQRAEAAVRAYRNIAGRLKEVLECGVCLQIFGTRSQDPDRRALHLSCGHSYCRSCLEGVLGHSVDSGIKCPNRCEDSGDVSENVVVSQVVDILSDLDLVE